MFYFQIEDREVQKRLLTRGSRLQEAVRKKLKEVGQSGVALAQGAAPRLTGTLFRSIQALVTVVPTGINLRVAPGKKGWYGVFAEGKQRRTMVKVKPYVRRGHEVKRYERALHLRHHPFLSPARKQVEQLAETGVREVIKEIVNE